MMGLYESYMGVYEQDEYIEEDVEEIDEAEGSYGRTPESSRRYSNRWGKDLQTNKRTEAGRYSASRLIRADNPDAGNFGKKSTLPAGDSPSDSPGPRLHRMARTGMTPYAREQMRGEIPTRPGGMPKGKKLARQRAGGISDSYDYDLYDLVLEYLLDEGLCESVENAEIMMAHMSEGWVESIVEGFKPTQYNTSGNIFTGRTRKAAQIDKQIGKLKASGKSDGAMVVDALNRRADSPMGREESREIEKRNEGKPAARARRDAQRDEKESRKGR
jgi:hypothetical protein